MQFPLTFSVDYPDRPLSRLSTLLRIFYAIPILIVLGLISGSTYETATDDASFAIGTAGGILVGATALMIIFRQKYPRWWFDFNVELTRFSTRVFAYLLLMDDRYPSTDEQQAVHLDVVYPDVPNDLNRYAPLWKWFLAIPHYIVLGLLAIALFFVVVFAWFAILFTGRYPRSLFEFVEGYLRWANRVGAYTALLVTDQYPPFGMK